MANADTGGGLYEPSDSKHLQTDPRGLRYAAAAMIRSRDFGFMIGFATALWHVSTT